MSVFGTSDSKHYIWQSLCDARHRGWVHSVTRQWVPFSSPLTQMVSTVFELFSWLQKRFRPPDPDATTNTALEAIASSSGKSWPLSFCLLLMLDDFQRNSFTGEFGFYFKHTFYIADFNWNVKAYCRFGKSVTESISNAIWLCTGLINPSFKLTVSQSWTN